MTTPETNDSKLVYMEYLKSTKDEIRNELNILDGELSLLNSAITELASLKFKRKIKQALNLHRVRKSLFNISPRTTIGFIKYFTCKSV